MTRLEKVGPNLYKWLAGSQANIGGEAMEVLPSCGRSNGHWHCTTHPREFFRNNFEKDGHIHDPRKTHQLLWMCYEHGPEQP